MRNWCEERTAQLIAIALFVIALGGCAESPQPSPDIEATVESRVVEALNIQATVESKAEALAEKIVEATAQAYDQNIDATSTPIPSATPVIDEPTPTPTPIPAQSTSTPAPVAMATPVPIQSTATPQLGTQSRNDLPSGKLTIAVGYVPMLSGLPSACVSLCSQAIYEMGVTDTLFSATANSDGTIAAEPMLATEFSLDPSLEFAKFKLREGVQFHNGWGEMTAEDVAFTFNNANAATNPGSNHGRAQQFAEFMASMEPLDKYTVRLNYRSYDSRGVLHGFSQYYRSAGIASHKVFEAKGVDGMQEDYAGVGAFVVEESLTRSLSLSAFYDYYATDEEDIGPFVEKVQWTEATGYPSHVLLESELADIVRTFPPDYHEILDGGFELQKGGMYSKIHTIYSPKGCWGATQQNREQMVAQTGGFGLVNHQPFLSISDPNYREEWSWDNETIGRETYPHASHCFDSNSRKTLWVGNRRGGSRFTFSVDGDLVTKVTEYSTIRPHLINGTPNHTAYLDICGTVKLPFDWAKKFAVGQQAPYVDEIYSAMVAETDKDKRKELAAELYTKNRQQATCIGLFEEPIWPAYNSSRVSEWEMTPIASSATTINNIRTVKLR